MNTREEAFKESAALGNIPAVTRYLQTGVDVNHRNKVNGWTALHWAASRGHRDIVKLLVVNGADQMLLDASGRSAVDVATGDCRDYFGVADNVQEVKEVAITPNYIRAPEAMKLWSVPLPEDVMAMPSDSKIKFKLPEESDSFKSNSGHESFRESVNEMIRDKQNSFNSRESDDMPTKLTSHDSFRESVKEMIRDEQHSFKARDSVRDIVKEKDSIKETVNARATLVDSIVDEEPPRPEIEMLVFRDKGIRTCIGAIFFGGGSWGDAVRQIEDELEVKVAGIARIKGEYVVPVGAKQYWQEVRRDGAACLVVIS